MKILAVDDDASIRELLPMILEEAGFTDVTLASSAQDALSIIAKQTVPFECFLLDIQMPGGNGIELCEAVRELAEYKKTPVIMLTAMHEKSFIDAAFAAGATDYTTKPFDVPAICARLRMANLLVTERRLAKELSRMFGKTNKKRLDKSKADFAKAINITGVKGLISSQALANYVTQLSRPGFQHAIFFAIHVENGRRIYDKGTSSDFEYALRHISNAALTSPMLGAVIMCYVGNGNFICCANAATLASADQIETNIQSMLDDKHLTYDDGSSLDVEITVGGTVQPVSGDTLRMTSLELQAVNQAMIRVDEKRFESTVLGLKRVGT